MRRRLRIARKLSRRRRCRAHRVITRVVIAARLKRVAQRLARQQVPRQAQQQVARQVQRQVPALRRQLQLRLPQLRKLAQA